MFYNILLCSDLLRLYPKIRHPPQLASCQVCAVSAAPCPPVCPLNSWLCRLLPLVPQGRWTLTGSRQQHCLHLNQHSKEERVCLTTQWSIFKERSVRGGAWPESLNRRPNVTFCQLGTFAIDGLELRKTAATRRQITGPFRSYKVNRWTQEQLCEGHFYLCRDLLCQSLELRAVGVFISILEHLVGDPHGAWVDLVDAKIFAVWRKTQRKLKLIDSHIFEWATLFKLQMFSYQLLMKKVKIPKYINVQAVF